MRWQYLKQISNVFVSQVTGCYCRLINNLSIILQKDLIKSFSHRVYIFIYIYIYLQPELWKYNHALLSAFSLHDYIQFTVCIFITCNDYIVTYILESNGIKKADGQPLALHTLLSGCWQISATQLPGARLWLRVTQQMSWYRMTQSLDTHSFILNKRHCINQYTCVLNTVFTLYGDSMIII